MPTTLRNLDILFNDGSTQSTAATNSSTAYGGVGTYVTAYYNVNTSAQITPGTTVAGSTLGRYPDVAYMSGDTNVLNSVTGTTYQHLLYGMSFVVPTSLGLSGTWRAMTLARNGTGSAAQMLILFLRVT